MASITVMFADNKFGVQNYTYNIKDEDVERLYKINCLLAGANLEHLEKRSGVDIQTVRNIQRNLAEDFMRIFAERVTDLEYSYAMQQALERKQEVIYNLQEN